MSRGKKKEKHQVRLMLDRDTYASWAGAAKALGVEPGAMLRRIAESVHSPACAAEMYSRAVGDIAECVRATS